jgi:5-methylcytosine-specific restriction enzyme subunit McrC
MTEAVHAQHRITGHTTLLETATIDVSSSIDMLARLRRLLLCEDAALSAS